MQESHNAFTWHDLSTQTLKNPSGDVLAGCDPGHVTVKNGFCCLCPEVTTLDVSERPQQALDAHIQQRNW